MSKFGYSYLIKYNMLQSRQNDQSPHFMNIVFELAKILIYDITSMLYPWDSIFKTSTSYGKHQHVLLLHSLTNNDIIMHTVVVITGQFYLSGIIILHLGQAAALHNTINFGKTSTYPGTVFESWSIFKLVHVV